MSAPREADRVRLVRTGGIGAGWWPRYRVETADGRTLGCVEAVGCYPRHGGDRPLGWSAERAHGPRSGLVSARGLRTRADAVDLLTGAACSGCRGSGWLRPSASGSAEWQPCALCAGSGRTDCDTSRGPQPSRAQVRTAGAVR